MPKAAKASKAGRKKTMGKSKRKSTSAAGPVSLETDTGVYFWKPEGEHGWLGQWHACAFKDDVNPSIVYKTAEHYMMYQKAILFKDPEIAEEILSTTNPRKVKALGRAVRNFDEAVWNANRERVVKQGNICKFTLAVNEADSDELRAKLLATGEKELVEASPMDRVWGVGFGATNASKSEYRERWGMNLLGKALMDVRAELRAREKGRKASEGEKKEEA